MVDLEHARHIASHLEDEAPRAAALIAEMADEIEKLRGDRSRSLEIIHDHETTIEAIRAALVCPSA